MPVEDAGESECSAVMVVIGVQTLPYPERVQTSYAGVTGRQRRGKPYRRLCLQWVMAVRYYKRPSQWSISSGTVSTGSFAIAG